MGKKLNEINAQILAFDLIKISRYWLLVFPRYLGGPLLRPAEGTIDKDEDFRRVLTEFTIIVRTCSWPRI